MSRLLFALPLLSLTGCLTVDPNAPQIPGLAWRVTVGMIVGMVFGFWAGWIFHASFRK